MEGKREIVENLAKERRVEQMLEKIAGTTLCGDLKDLAQDVYVVLLNYDEEKIRDLHVNGQINFFIARIITNQYRSHTSPFHTNYRRPSYLQRINEETCQLPEV